MRIERPTALLGGLSPRAFMTRYWQKRPLLIRQAVPDVRSPMSRAELFDLASRDDVESRLVARDGARWTLRRGPLRRRAIPSPRRPRWTLLVQGLDLHVDAAHQLLERFRFVPDARLDDLMLSYATDGGGVGPHVDSYDVFLLQVHGTRDWRIAHAADPRLLPGAPLRVLARFTAEQAWSLEPGDMLYLPPGWAHDGVARGECMTCSIGFRSPGRRAVVGDVLQRWLDAEPPPDDGPRYRDRRPAATAAPARIPRALQDFAAAAVARGLSDRRRLACALGEWLSEPKPTVVFDAGSALSKRHAVRLDRRTRMLYDEHHVFVNGEAHRAGGRDATLLRRLADRHRLAPHELAGLSSQARSTLDAWARAGWLRSVVPQED
jgi:50S ribosomal protein L16 3-hydroxylase